MKKLLGLDGLTNDETVTRYYTNGHGLIVKEVWGGTVLCSPTQALAELLDAREAEHRAELMGDPLAVQRMGEIQRTIDAVEAML